MTYKALIKIDLATTQEQQSQAIAEGVSEVCVLLLREYGRSAEEITIMLERAMDDVEDEAILIREGE